MTKFRILFDKFLIISVLILLGSLSIFEISHLYLFFQNNSIIGKLLGILLILVNILIFYTGYRIIRHYIDKGLRLNSLAIYIAVFAFLLRFIWILAVNTLPVSDFEVMFSEAGKVWNGDFSCFHGTGYIARYMHLTFTVLYFSLFHGLFSNPLFWIKFVNAVLSSFAVYLLYLLVKEIYDEVKGLAAAFIFAISPPFIMYTSVTMSENMAVPIFIGATYLFLKYFRNKSLALILAAGLVFCLANFMRSVGMIFIPACIVYLLVYRPFKENFRNIACILSAYLIPFFIASSILMSLGISEYPLWKGREPSTTSILKGTNFESGGRWNQEDAALPDRLGHDYDKVDKAAKELIAERIMSKSPIFLARFYIVKYFSQWGQGDFDSYFWSVQGLKNNNPIEGFLMGFPNSVRIYTDLFYLILLVMTLITLFINIRRIKDRLQYFMILFGGFVVLFLIIEIQGRYSFIMSWVFIILSLEGFEKLYNIIKRKWKRLD